MSDIDITEIMRDKAAGRKNQIGDYWGDCWCENAAENIERLREEVKELNDEIDHLYEQAAGEDI